MPINLFYFFSVFFMFSFIMSSFLLLEFQGQAKFLLPYKPDSFSNTLVSGCIKSFILYARYFANQIKTCIPLYNSVCIPVLQIFAFSTLKTAQIGIT